MAEIPTREPRTVDGKVDVAVAESALPVGAATEATLFTRATEATLTTRAAAAQLPSALVEGRLDTNIGAWLGSTAPTVGQKARAASLPCALASDQATEANPLVAHCPRIHYDAFGRLRTSEPATIFDSKFLANAQPLTWDDAVVSGSGGASTYNTNQASVTLSCAANTAVFRVRQTYQRFNYQAGKSTQWMLTGVLGNPAPGITTQIGEMDDANGLFFESAPSGVRVVIRTSTSGSPVDNRYERANWNVDKLDGSGPSGITADWTKLQVFGCFYQWLGSGSVWFFVSIGGENQIVHRVDTANFASLVYMSTPNLPLRVSIRNDGTGGAASVTHVCATVMSEGGRADLGIALSATRGTSLLTTLNNDSFFPVIAFRIGAGFKGALIELLGLDIQPTGNATFNWVLLLNPTVTGTALSFAAVTNSALEVALTSTNATTVSGGMSLQGGTTGGNGTNATTVELAHTDLRLGFSIAGVADFVVFAVQRIGAAFSATSTINWRETQ